MILGFSVSFRRGFGAGAGYCGLVTYRVCDVLASKPGSRGVLETFDRDARGLGSPFCPCLGPRIKLSNPFALLL